MGHSDAVALRATYVPEREGKDLHPLKLLRSIKHYVIRYCQCRFIEITFKFCMGENCDRRQSFFKNLQFTLFQGLCCQKSIFGQVHLRGLFEKLGVRLTVYLPELSSNSAEDRILRETASSPWDSSASLTPTTAQQRQENSSEVSEFHLPAEENFISNRSQIQQIIDKYTKDLNWLPEHSTSFHGNNLFRIWRLNTRTRSIL